MSASLANSGKDLAEGNTTRSLIKDSIFPETSIKLEIPFDTSIEETKEEKSTFSIDEVSFSLERIFNSEIFLPSCSCKVIFDLL